VDVSQYPERQGPTVLIRFLLFCSLPATIWLFTPRGASGQVPPPEVQVAAAALAAPPGQDSDATVLGYDPSGKLVSLRGGQNDLVCLADDPSDDGFSVACYHDSLDPYMARGRELSAGGTTDGAERNQIRWDEADDGRLAMPDGPVALFVLTGSGYDPANGEVVEPYLRYVIYVPWATLESTGLPAQPMGPGSPWLMFPGTAGAHIMISPPRPPGGP
jgi:hypothetical protein